MRFLWLGSALAVTALAFACGGSGEDSAVSGAALDQGTEADAPADAGADAGTLPVAAVDPTPLALNGSTREIAYASAAPLPAYAINAPAGTKLTILVDARTRGGRPDTAVVNAAYRPVASNNPGAGSAFLQYTVTPADGPLFLVVRDARKRNGNFLVTIYADLPPPPPPPPPQDAGATKPPVVDDAGTR